MYNFICPYCKAELQKKEKSFICENGHNFDIAKEGYTYLLPVNKKHSKIPGDTKEMTDARRNFLNKGYYEVFSDKLNELTLKYAGENSTIIDAGCGEGYYTGRLCGFLNENKKSFSLSGFDISKSAIKSAAKTYKAIDFCVASIFDIPVADGKADIVINIFAPMQEKEMGRILKRGGIMIFAVPSEKHLWGLKEIVYEKPYENEYKDTSYAGFHLLERVSVRSEIDTCDTESIRSLFQMTPYFWKTDKEGSRRVEKIEHLKTEIGFDFLVYEKEKEKSTDY